MAKKLLINTPDARRALDGIKLEVAQEFGVELNGETSARLNGAVGGEIVKRLIALAEANILR